VVKFGVSLDLELVLVLELGIDLVLWLVLWLAEDRCRISAGPTDMVTSQ
jgi:hypothetical protein